MPPSQGYTGITPSTSGCCSYAERCNDTSALNYDPSTNGGGPGQVVGGCFNSNGIVDVRNTSCCNYRTKHCKYVMEDAPISPVLIGPYTPGQWIDEDIYWEENTCVPNSFYPGGLQKVNDWNGTNSPLFGSGWLYETYSEATYNNVYCNSGQTCCPFEREESSDPWHGGSLALGYTEYRSDYNRFAHSHQGCTTCCNTSLGTWDSAWASWTPNPPPFNVNGPVSYNGYDSVDAYVNARDSGIMCNCAMQKPSLLITHDAGQTGPPLWNVSDWPPVSTPWPQWPPIYPPYIIITDDIRKHPPNFYIDMKICGYPGDLSVHTLNSPQLPTLSLNPNQFVQSYHSPIWYHGDVAGGTGTGSAHRTRFFEYNDQYVALQIPLGGNIYNVNDPNSLIPNEGLRPGINVVELRCENNRKITYSFCVPHQTLPYPGSTAQYHDWFQSTTSSGPYFKTSFFNCNSGPSTPDLPIEDA